MKKIKINDFSETPTNLWLHKWLLLTSGDLKHFNSMTVAWGSIGGLWQKPFVQVFVRPSRYTYEFMNSYKTFTLCTFPKEYKKALALLGSKSGRDGDKIAEAKLTPIASEVVQAPSFKEADLIIECVKTYYQDMDPKNFLSKDIMDNYPANDFHRIYYGEIVNILQS